MPVKEGKRLCRKCGEWKENIVTVFRCDRGKPSSPCRACHYKRTKEYAQNHKDKMAEYNRAYVERHPNKRRDSCALWRKGNPEKERAASKRWAENNKGRCRARVRKRQMRLSYALPQWLSDEDYLQIVEMYEKARNLELSTGIPHEVDHIEPIQGKDRCGLHVPWNLRVVPRSVNRSKGNTVY